MLEDDLLPKGFVTEDACSAAFSCIGDVMAAFGSQVSAHGFLEKTLLIA